MNLGLGLRFEPQMTATRRRECNNLVPLSCASRRRSGDGAPKKPVAASELKKHNYRAILSKKSFVEKSRIDENTASEACFPHLLLRSIAPPFCAVVLCVYTQKHRAIAAE